MSGSTKFKRLILLGTIFLFCFIAAFATVSGIYNSDSNKTPEGGDSEDTMQNSDLVFPEAVQINRQGKYLAVVHGESLLPKAKNDFLLFLWINLKNLPDKNSRLVILSKYKGQPPRIQGYALGLKRDDTSLRPVLFWGDGSAEGRWYDFPEIPMATNEWHFFAVHFHKSRFAGLYTARIMKAAANPAIRFLGGHEIVTEDPMNLGTAEMIFGAPEGRDFKGKIGPFGILNPLSLEYESLPAALGDYVKNPLDFSVLGDDSDFGLLVKDGKTDSSEKQNIVKTSG